MTDPQRVLHCWADYREVTQEQWTEAPAATCMLPLGHESEHCWTPDNQILVRFREEAPADDDAKPF